MRFNDLLIMAVAFGVVVGLVIFGQQQARKRGLEIDYLSPSGDPTRHVLASLVLRGALFRNLIIRNLRNPFLARAVEPALDMALIEAAAKRIEADARPAQWGIVLGVLVWFFLVPPPLKLWVLLAWAGFCIYLQFRDRFRLVKAFERENYDPAKLRTQYPCEPPIPTAGHPVLVSGVFNPFIGLGLNLGGWNIALDVSRPAEGKLRARPLTAPDIERALTDAILSLQIPNLVLVDRLLVSGVEVGRVPQLQPDRLKAPATEIPAAVAEAYRGQPDDRARLYSFATITSFGGEVVVSYAFRVLRRGASLGVEVVHLAAAPLAPKYREVDHLRVVGIWSGILWFLTAVARVPLQLLGAIASIVTQLTEVVEDIFGGHVAREQSRILRDPAYNYGARFSLRAFTASPNYNSWFQKADVQQYLRGLEEQVLNALRDCLEAHDIDARAFASQSMTVHNNNVQITSNRDVNLQGVAIGQGAKATSVLGRLGMRSGKREAA